MLMAHTVSMLSQSIQQGIEIMAFGKGFGIGLGIVFGMGLGLVACGAVATTIVGKAGDDLNARLAKATAQIEATIPDDLEVYRACVKGYYNAERQNPVEAITACDDQLNDWKDSPTFSDEWLKLVRTDSEFATILANFNEIMNP
jgi:hypothetical protein